MSLSNTPSNTINTSSEKPISSGLPSSRTASKEDNYGDKIVEDESRDSLERIDAEDIEKATSAPVEKKSTRISVNHLASIPNGGLRAWMQVLGAFFLFFNTW